MLLHGSPCLAQEHKPESRCGLQQTRPVVPALFLGRGEEAEVESALKPTVHRDSDDFDGLSSFVIAQRLGEVPQSPACPFWVPPQMKR